MAPARVDTIANPVLSEPMLTRLAKSIAARKAHAGRRFIAVGRLVPQKNLQLLLRAFARGAAADDTLTLVGDGPERAALVALAEQLGVSDRVDFRGYTPDAGWEAGVYDCLLLSSDYEGLPAVVVEALAAGLAIVATDCSRTLPELLADGALGTLVPVRDVNALAAAIATAGCGSPDPDRAVRQARQFTIEQSAPAFLRIMATLPARVGRGTGKAALPTTSKSILAEGMRS